jgi:hypothetical protein
LIFGGIIGWFIVDPATGAMWTLDTNDVDVTLDSAKPSASLLQFGETKIVLLQDVPASLRSKMIKLTK